MNASINGMAERVREQLARPGHVIELPGCYDVLSAMVLESAGFSAVFLSGYGVAASLCGNPDIGLTTLSETVLMTRNTAAAVRVPLVVDADNGYGNEDNVTRVVAELEAAGAAAIILEDQVLPKRCGHAAGKAVVPLAAYMRKLEAAMRVRRTPLVIVARTDSPVLDDAIERARTFQAAGADVVLIDGLPSLEAIHRVADEVPGPKQINLIYGGKSPMLRLDELGRLGFKVVLYSTPALYVAFRAMTESMRVLQERHDLDAIAGHSASFGEFQKFLADRYADRTGHVEPAPGPDDAE